MSVSADGVGASMRCTGAVAPVEVSLCAHAYASASAGCGSVTVPGSTRVTAGSDEPRRPRDGGRELVSELAEHAQRRRLLDEAKLATSQNCVEPPLPRTTS
jgi:hypothetical protein